MLQSQKRSDHTRTNGDYNDTTSMMPPGNLETFSASTK